MEMRAGDLGSFQLGAEVCLPEDWDLAGWSGFRALACIVHSRGGAGTVGLLFEDGSSFGIPPEVVLLIHSRPPDELEALL